MDRTLLDVAHLLAGGLLLVSFMMLYQDRLPALFNVFALHAFILALSVAWQAYIQAAPHLYVTAGIALIFKAIVIPVALRRIVVKLGIYREIEPVVGDFDGARAPLAFFSDKTHRRRLIGEETTRETVRLDDDPMIGVVAADDEMCGFFSRGGLREY